MKVYFSEKTERRIDATAEYIKDEFGCNAEHNFKRKICDTVRLLRRNPYLGPIEPLLSDLPEAYRSIVVGSLNKMVYHIVDDRIEVSDFWDCRREPETQAKQVK